MTSIIDTSRTARLAQFLRAAVEVKIRKVTEVAKYPSVQWFSELPIGLSQVRSPLLAESWDTDDLRWLIVSRVQEPDLPTVPGPCEPWLDGVDLRTPEKPPELIRTRTSLNDVGEQVTIEPSCEVRAIWQKYFDEKWAPWADRAKIARLVRPIYRRLFNIHQEMLGREDGYDLFVGIGLLYDRRDPSQPLRRHLLAFPAELAFDSRSGTLTVSPASDFDRPCVELDFLPSTCRSLLKRQMDEVMSSIDEIGPVIQDRLKIGDILRSLVHSLGSETIYLDELTPQDTPVHQARASFAPALIMRPRNARSLDELLAGIERDASGTVPRVPLDACTIPWRRLIEDERIWGAAGNSNCHPAGPSVDRRIYFPLPTNEEQSKIIRHSDGTAGAVVQGPPGTGKSHTIANLISHYLATGRRVLVTAQTSQALQVLRDKVPVDLQPLCVSLLGAGRASDKELERSVKGILARQQEAEDPRNYERQASEIEAQLQESEKTLAARERILLDARVSETVEVHPVPGYKGKRAAIARQLKRERPDLGWIQDDIPHETCCPTYTFGWQSLVSYHQGLEEEKRRRLAEKWIALPFAADTVIDAVKAIEEIKRAIDAEGSPAVEWSSPTEPNREALKVAIDWLLELEHAETPPAPDHAAWLEELRTAVLRHNLAPWQALEMEAIETLGRLTEDVVAGTLPVVIAGGRTQAEAWRDLSRLSQHYASGGKRRVLLVFKPAIVRETEWIQQHVHVDGAPVRTPAEVSRARRALDGLRRFDRAWEVWAHWSVDRKGSPRQQVACLRTRHDRLQKLLDIGMRRDSLSVAISNWLSQAATAGLSTRDLLAECRRRHAELGLAAARARRDELIAGLRKALGNAHVAPGMLHVQNALRAEDLDSLSCALAEHEHERQEREQHSHYVRFIEAVREVAPKTAESIVADEGTSSWTTRFPRFESAWAHRCASFWQELMLSKPRIQGSERAARDERVRIQELTRDLAVARAWFHALKRIDERKRQSLVAWSQAVAHIPKTGPSVFRRRTVARSFLAKCLDAIPAWVVSLGRLYDTVEAHPGLFDVAIVDESSQCWLDSLALFYLAKQVIVVGDDKQISPTLVGVKEGEVERLANTYLRDFEHRGMFTLESSLFDHARRYLPASIPLREHFRCVPEIIRFSNELCYTDTPLIPLRQCGRDRLEPLKAIFLPDGIREGDINEAEARAVVDAIVRCHADEAYEECDFGVICLQGDDQAARIQQLLLERLGPGVFAERNLRCGDAYAFQGDERDVMFLSMIAAPNAQNAPLTTARYEQRFNVSLSRARNQMWLFHSIREQDLSPNCLRRKVLSFFYQPPDTSIRGVELKIPQLRLVAERADRMTEHAPTPFDSWFEVDVALALVARGYTLSAQVQVARKRIDLVVEGDDGVRLAVECDGETWHGPEQYERDLFRQHQLERAQWRFVRVRESLFYSDEERAIEEVVAACDELGIGPGGGRAAPAAAATVSEKVLDLATWMLSSDMSRDAAPITETVSQEITTVSESAAPYADVAYVADSEEPSAEAGEESVVTLLSDERVGPYTGYRGKSYPDPRTAPVANVRDAILDIVQTDGPLPKASIYALYRDGCPRIERAGKQLRHVLNSAIYTLQRMRKVVVLDEGNRRDPTEVVLRLPEQHPIVDRPRGARQIEGIPLSELASVFRELSEGRPPDSPRADIELQRRVLDRFDLRNLTQRTQARLARAEALAFDEDFWRRLQSETPRLF